MADHVLLPHSSGHRRNGFLKDFLTHLFSKAALTKGQLISKCPLGVIIWTKIPTKKFDKFCPRI